MLLGFFFSPFNCCYYYYRQNAELDKLHQDIIRLNKELVEKNDSLQAEEQLRKNLESKAATAEKQLTELQVRGPSSFNHSVRHRCIYIYTVYICCSIFIISIDVKNNNNSIITF